MNTKQITVDMSPALREELQRLGWKPARVTWGRRVSGDMHGAVIERDGTEKYHAGPFTAVRAGDQMAIVRWG
jgi:hypothetical protein